MKNKLIYSVLGGLLIFSLLTGCTPQATTSTETASTLGTEASGTSAATEATGESTPKVGGTLVYGQTSQPDTLDSQLSALSVSDSITWKMNVGLVAKSLDGRYIPYAAESWETSEDGLTWTFHLRQDIKFHNGDAVTAKDWVYTFSRLRDPNIVSPVSASMIDAVENFEAADDYTLVLTLGKPFYPLLENLTDGGYLGVISQRFIEEKGSQYGTTEGGFMGAGPYTFKEWVQDEKIVLERNPDFTWGPEYFEGCNKGPYYIQTIEYRFIPDYATIVASLETGELSYSAVDIKDVETIQNTGLYNEETTLLNGISDVVFNIHTAPFDNETVRQAFNYAIDRQKVLDIVAGGQGQVVYTPLSPSMMGYPDLEGIGYTYDPEKAKQLLQEVGYTYNAEGLAEKDGVLFEVVLSSDSTEGNIKQAQLLQTMLKDIGVTVNIETSDEGVLLQKITDRTYQMCLMVYGWPDTDIMSYIFGTGGYFSADDSQLDALLDKTRTELDPDLHKQATRDAVNYVVDHALDIPLYAPLGIGFIDKNIQGRQVSGFTEVWSDAYFTNVP